MTDNSRIELEALIAEREGMLVANIKSRSQGKLPVYTDSSFQAIARQMRELKECHSDA